MYITKEDIQCAASSLAVFEKGKLCYQKDGVGPLKVMQKEDYLEIRAEIQDESGNYRTNVEVYNNRIAWHECDCIASFQNEGLCKHMVAMLLKYYNELMPQLKREIRGERYSRKALAFYEDQLLKEQEIESSNIQNPIKAVLRLVEDEACFNLNLSIGENRLYIVKDLYEFAENMKQGNTASYGKHLEFIHDLQIFERESRAIVQFIMDKTTEYTSILQQIGLFKGFPKAERKSLPLNAKAFDDFFELVESKPIDVVRDKTVEKVFCMQGEPDFSLEIHKEETYYTLVSSMQDYVPFESTSYKYLLTKDRLYRLNKGFAINVFPLLKHMYHASHNHGQRQLEFSEILMKRFMLSSLEKVRKYVPLIIEETIAQNIQPAHVIIRSFFDLDEAGGIIGDIELQYEQLIFNPYKTSSPEEIKKLEDIPRDTPKESRLNGILRKYDFRTHNGHLHLSDEDKIYDFMNTGMEELLSLGEVNITERLKGIKIIKKPVGSLGIKLQNNMLYVSLQDINMPIDEIQALLLAYKRKSKYYRLKDGSFMNIKQGIVRELVGITEGLGLEGKELIEGEVAIPQYRALYLDQILKQNEEMVIKRDKYFKQIIRDIRNIEDADYEVPTSIKANLRSYQEVGYRWLSTMAHYGFGGILADDMGLGKTLQIITLLTAEYESQQMLPSLVVCPTSLSLNWQAEIDKFAPHLKVLVMMGTVEERKKLLETLREYQVIIISYDLLKRDIVAYEDKQFRFCIADEAQYIKNANTLGAKALKAIKSEVCFALTGTPIENSLAELWSIFDFIMPGYLFNYSKFKERYEMPIVKNQEEEAITRLRRMITPFIIRRLKKDVLKELPDKTETIIYNCMTEEQQKIYTAHLAMARKELREEVAEKGLGSSRIKMLALLTRLRQLCCHPTLYLKDYAGGSGKLEQCMEIIRESIESGHKILLFSQFTTMLEIISRQLGVEGIEHLILTGATHAEDRLQMVTTFNHSPIPIFLISLKAGGTGLNLTGADVVIHYDPWWNLSSQNQATDRAYRIGQKNNVQVFQMITKHSIEEKIKELQDKKIGLTENILQEGEAFISRMSEEEITALFTD